MPYIEKSGNRFNLDNSGKADISDINDIIHMIAFKYNDTTGTYNEGDYSIYEQSLYKCITPVSIPEEFDSTKWQIVNIVSVLKYLEQNIPGSGINLPAGNFVSPNNIQVGPFGVVTEVGGE